MNSFLNLSNPVVQESKNSYVVHKNNSTIIIEEVPCLIVEDIKDICYSDKVVSTLEKLVDILFQKHSFKVIIVNYIDAVNYYL